MLKKFILCQRAEKAYYLYREIATFVSSGEVKGNNEDKRKTEENRIPYLVN